MTAEEILGRLEELGSEGYRNILLKHGIPEPLFGVKVEELKKFEKKIKADYQLALDLYATGIYDAMYLAGLVADCPRMTRADLRRWLKGATSPAIREYTLAWTAAESDHGRELALEWIDTAKEEPASAGWATLSSLVAISDDADLDLPELEKLLKRVKETIGEQPNRVRYTMNGFVIAAGCYVAPLTETALRIAGEIGPITVEKGDTECKVPSAVDAIRKVKGKGTTGKKRKTAKC